MNLIRAVEGLRDDVESAITLDVRFRFRSRWQQVLPRWLKGNEARQTALQQKFAT